MPPNPSSSRLPPKRQTLKQLLTSLEPLSKEASEQPSPSSLLALYLQWLRSDLETYESLTLAGKSMDSQALASFDVYAGLGLLWRLRFSSRAICSLEASSVKQQKTVLGRALDLAAGRLGDCGLLDCGPMRHLVCMQTEISPMCLVVVALELNRLPLVAGNRLSGFTFTHFLRVIDVVTGLDEAEESLKVYKSELRADPAKCIRPLICSNIEAATKLVVFEDSVTPVSEGILGPKPVSTEFLTNSEIRSYFFDAVSQRWVQSLANRPKSSKEQLSSDIQAMISRLSGSESCKAMVRWLKTAHVSVQLNGESDDSAKLSENELDVLGTPGNVLAIGRSGTGKTTCAALRLFGFMKLFRGWLRAQNYPEAKLVGLHMVFVTASKALTKKVKNYFEMQVKRLVPSGSTIEALKKPTVKSMNRLKHRDFPLFLTVSQLISAIDASLSRPFFKEATEGQGLGVNAGFHNQAKKLKLLSARGKFAFEVTFDCFERDFWPTVRFRGSLSPLLVWTEIVSRLKGWVSSAAYCQGHLPKAEYFGTHKNKSLLSDQERLVVWEVFLQYESWKFAQVAYDFQDVVTHVLQELAVTGYKGAPIHYLVIDEVQDITHATLALLAKVSQHGFFLAGDTAQTIAKGITFRFKDMKTVFGPLSDLDMDMPATVRLASNFRTHQKVLRLANFVVKLIELLFPKVIDKLSGDTSENPGEGLTPTWLRSSDFRPVQAALMVTVREENAGSRESADSNSVILLANEEAKACFPEVLSNLQHCTIYESKGDEFDTVVLYNFFSNCGVTEEQWTTLTDYLEENSTQIVLGVRRDKVKLARFFSAKYAAICSALKLFYVAITRTKRQFLIFDNSQAAQLFLSLLVKLGLIEVAETANRQRGEVDAETFKRDWSKQGVKFTEQKMYKRAALCFQYAGETLKAQKADNLHRAMEAARELQAAEAVLTHSEASIEQKRLAEMSIEGICMRFRSIAVDLLTTGSRKEAARCFFSGRDFQSAIGMYMELGEHEELAQSCYKAGNYGEAGRWYTQAGNYLGALESYKKGQKWMDCFLTLSNIRESISPKKKVEMARNYAYLAFEPSPSPDLVAFPSTLTKKDKATLRQSFSPEDCLLEDINEVVEKAVGQTSQTDLREKWVYREGQVSYNPCYERQEIVDLLIEVGRIVEPLAFEYEATETGTAYLRSPLSDLPPSLSVWQTLSIFKVMHMWKFYFLLSTLQSLLRPLQEALEFQALALSSTRYVRNSKKWEKLGVCYSWIANYAVSRCFEVIKPHDLCKFDEPEDSILPGMVILGYWKLVVAISRTYRAEVAKVFDVRTAQQLYRSQSRGSSASYEATEAQLCYLEGYLVPAMLRKEHCEANSSFRLCELLLGYLRRGSVRETALTAQISQIFVRLKQLLAQERPNPLAIADFFAFYSLFLRRSESQFIEELSFADFEQVLLAGNLCIRLLTYTSPKQQLEGYKYMLRAILAAYEVRLMSGELCFAGLPAYSHAVMSSFAKDSLEIPLDSMLCVDIEGKQFVAPLLVVLEAIQAKIITILTNLTIFRNKKYQRNRPISSLFIDTYKRLKVTTAVSVCGELYYVKTLRSRFPQHYSSARSQVGQKAAIDLTQQIDELEDRLQQLSVGSLEGDDVDFQLFLSRSQKSKLQSQIKKLKEAKRKLRKVDESMDLQGNLESSKDFDTFYEGFLITVYEALGQSVETSPPLTSLARFALLSNCQDLKGRAVLDSIGAILGCQELLQQPDYPALLKELREKVRKEELEVEWSSTVVIISVEDQMLLDDLHSFVTLAPGELQLVVGQEAGLFHRLDTAKVEALRTSQLLTVPEQREEVYRVQKLLAQATQKLRSALIQVAASQRNTLQGKYTKARGLQEAEELGERALATAQALSSKATAWKREIS